MMTLEDAPAPPDVLAAALDLAALGWRVLPIKPGGKHPPLPQWQKAATTDADTIRSWFTGLYRGHGLGVACGPLPDGRCLFVVDIDRHGDVNGPLTLDELERRHKPLPPTVESLTGSGGRHLFYWAPRGMSVRNNAGTRLGPGLDIRGDGGQVVVAPSVHPNGQPYQWVRDPTTTLAKAPGWLLDLVVDRPAPVSTAVSMAPPGAEDDSIAAWLNVSTDWHALLMGDGWTLDHVDGETEHWTRPGKADGTSAVLHLPDGPFVVWSTSVPALQQPWATTKKGDGWAFSKFGYIAATRHAGNRSEAARSARVLRNGPTQYIDPRDLLPAVLDAPGADENDWTRLDLSTLAEQIENGTLQREEPDVLEVHS